MKTLVANKMPGFVFACFLLIGSSSALAADTDGDGIADSSLTQISSGQFHACALNSSVVSCWGYNASGQTTVPALTNPTAVSAGYSHTCAIDATGVHCWGSNLAGESTVPALTNPTAVSAGGLHTCAIDATGVHCWGYNFNGQTTVPSLTNPVMVSAGGYHTCALDATGVHCWGEPGGGRTAVPSLTNPVAVTAATYHTCALDATGVHCWGTNAYGETSPPSLTNPVSVSAGAFQTCARDATGVRCWGYNGDGQTTVPVLNNPTAVSSGYYFTCALDADGVRCWGNNSQGQTAAPAFGDNCKNVSNADQLNTDGDAMGDACDTDDDNDSVLDVDDAFPLDDTETVDADNDNLGDNTDPITGDGDNLNIIPGEIKVDKAGSSVAYAGDFDGDGYGDYVIGIPGYDLPATSNTKIQKDAGRAIVISGRNGDELASVAGFAAKSAMGFAVAGNGDINNDGFADVVVGAPRVFKDSGSVTVLYGPDGGTPFTFFGPQEKALMGSALALTDWDHDNHADLVVGIPKANESLNSIPAAGCVIVVSGDGLSPILGADFCGDIAKAYFGTAVAVGDIDNDGSEDIIVGAPNDDDVTNKLKDTGSVMVYLNSGTPTQKRYGAVAKAYFGKSVAAGAVNNDSYADVLIGAPGDDNGALKDTGSVIVFSGVDGSTLTTKYGATAKAGLGNSVASGDINNDGFSDIIAGAKLDDKPSLPKIIKDTGSVTVFDGNSHNLITTLYGAVTKDAFGASVSAGDVNSDGKADLIIGIPGFDIPPALPTKTIKDTGAVKVVSGDSL